jgi:probable HAF family extracellular repeat protein
MLSTCRSSPVLATLSALVLLAASAPGQTINPVAPIGGGSISRAAAVNANGTAVAGYSENASSADIAVRWTNPGGSVSMGLLPGGVFNSYAVAIDATGTILAGYGDSGSTRAFRWTTGGGYQLLPVAAGASPANYNQALGISQSGAIVVGLAGLSGGQRAFRWDSASPFVSQNLGVLPSQSDSAAYAVSGDGSTVVGASGSRAFRWTGAGGMVDLGTLPGMLWARGEAASTNGSTIVGRYSTGSELGFRWTSTGGMAALPLMTGTTSALRPRAVSGDGKVVIGQVVDFAGVPGGQGAFGCFIWTPSGGTQPLATHLASLGINLTGWQLSDATGISADGFSMCGVGLFNGNPVGWVVRGLTCPSVNVGQIQSIVGCVGGTAQVFTSASSPSGVPLAYQWYRNNVPLSDGLQPTGSTLSGVNSSVLNFTNLQAADTGSYSVGLSPAGVCETISPAFAFSAPSALSLIIQPGSVNTCEGQSPSFFAVATFPTGGVVARWQRLVTPPSTFVDLFDGASGFGSTYVGAGSTTLAIFGAQPADAGTYRCIFSVAGCTAIVPAIGGPVTLGITPLAPTVTGPSNVGTCPGDNDVFFNVTATPGSTFQWQAASPPGSNNFVNIADGQVGPSSFYGQTNTNSLGLYGVGNGSSFSDKYRCIVVGPCGGQFITAPASFQVFTTPVVTGPVAASGCAGENGEAFFNAFTSPTPPGTTWQWQAANPISGLFGNIGDATIGNGGSYSGTATPFLTVSGLFPGGPMSFRCVVVTPCGDVITTPAAGLTILDFPVIATQPTGSLVCRGGSTSLSVGLAPGNVGPVSYQWFKGSTPLVNGFMPALGASFSGAQSPVLSVSGFSSFAAGLYSCVVSTNCAAIGSASANLKFCPADFNCSGALSVQDIFDFLGAWFAGCTTTGPAPCQFGSSDFNVSDSLSVQDIFDFLAAWFAGC